MKRIHLAGQWVFLKIEGVFNLAFGERLNPLYYLGPIAYYLMWLVVASGNSTIPTLIETGRKFGRMLLLLRPRMIAVHPMPQLLEEDRGQALVVVLAGVQQKFPVTGLF